MVPSKGVAGLPLFSRGAGPIPREQFIDPVDGVPVADPVEHIGQPCLRIYAVELGRRQQGVDRSGALSATFVSVRSEPSAPGQGQHNKPHDRRLNDARYFRLSVGGVLSGNQGIEQHLKLVGDGNVIPSGGDIL